MTMHRHPHPDTPAEQTVRRLALSLGLTLGFVLLEAAAGLLGNSLALLSDAAHNLTDVLALALAWYAVRLGTRPPHAGKTYGYQRAGILAALANATLLLLLSLGIFYEAVHRFLSPPEVDSAILVIVGGIAFAVNLVTAWLVKHGSEHDLNLQGAFLHLMGDVFSTLGAVFAGVLIAFTGYAWLDPLASALIGALILGSVWGILRETVDILLEGTPRDIDMDRLVCDLRDVPGVAGVHDLHVWSLTKTSRALSAHILTGDVSIRKGAEIQRRINEMLCREYNIGHATLQLEVTGCAPDMLYCGMNGPNPPSRAE